MIKKVVDNYYEAVIEGTMDVTGLPLDEVTAGFNSDIKKYGARAAILIGESNEDEDPHILYIDLGAFNGVLTQENLDEFNSLLQEKAKG